MFDQEHIAFLTVMDELEQLGALEGRAAASLRKSGTEQTFPSRRAPSFGEVRVASATRLAEEPEFTSSASDTPRYSENSVSNFSA